MKVILACLWRPRLDLLDGSVVHLRVWPNDLDLNLHVNNGRYMTLMDLGRFDLIFRMGMLRVFLQRGWKPLACSATVRFRRSLKAFHCFRIRTRLLCWDDRWIYFEQIIDRNGQLIAVGFVKAVLRSRTGIVPTAEILQALGKEAQSPPMPESVRLWQDSEAQAESAA
jgi:acyl-CoA thioesterase FadM